MSEDTVPIEAPQPSQLYLDAEKVASVLSWMDLNNPRYEPLPTLDLYGDLVLMDGHTRAFVAHLAGAERIRLDVRSSTGWDDPNVPLYRECVRWCREEGLTEIGDLVGRVLDPDVFRDRWIERCHDSPLYGE